MKFNFKRNSTENSSFKRPFVPKVKFLVIATFVLILLAFILIYIFHPPFNWHSPAFIFYLLLIFGFAFLESAIAYYSACITLKTFGRIQTYLLTGGGVVIIALVLAGVIVSPLFNAKAYAGRITITASDFASVEEVNFQKTPIIDRSSTEALGDRVMGQMPELVSQFEVSDAYTQISYQDSVYRVTPLEYADFYKYITNRNEGIPAYITVNSTTGEAKLVKLKDLGLKGMRYVPTEIGRAHV